MKRLSAAALFSFLFLLGGAVSAPSQTVKDCLECHGDQDLTTERNGKEVSVYVDGEKFKKSVHGDQECIACHADLEGSEFPHSEKVAPVKCGECHDEIEKVYEGSTHGELAAKGADLAPRCWSCHGAHDILPISSPDSGVSKFNVPFVCGKCHKEGTEVTRTYDISQHDILEHYSESMHGEGLYKKGLTVTAVCSDCHTAHNVRSHLDPKSSIFRDNIPSTCQKCHGQIEKVHTKVIRSELWEKEPNKVPICINCHAPHKARKIAYDEGISDDDCLACHKNPDLKTVRDGEAISLFVDPEQLHDSIHRNFSCVKCHTGATPTAKRACETVATKVDCSMCHEEVSKKYQVSIHGKLADKGDSAAPECTTCHGAHQIRNRKDPKSNTFPTNIPNLCGQCHGEGNKAAIRNNGHQHNILENYSMSIHGKGLLKSGLLVTAQCSDCHTAHSVLPTGDPASTVNPANIPATCAKCHKGIYEKFSQSIHSPLVSKTDKKLPSCMDCHAAHTITRTDEEGFKLSITNQCGKCHADVVEGYFETFHGKVSKLGFTGAAKCYDCHGSHEILPPFDARSTLSRDNIVSTCGKCHEGSHRQFAGYLTHATHHDRNKYPVLFYTFWFMTSLLVGTFIFFGIHTLLWFPRSFISMKQHKHLRELSKGKEVSRFSKLERQLHVLVVISFLGLAITGMSLKFSYLPWAQTLSRWLGGFETAGFIHRTCAIITFFYFGAHVFDLIRKRRASGMGWFSFLLGPQSMVPRLDDLKEFIATTKWFIGLGPRPRYGRWTYWEKFDYFAVFWGVTVIGSTGLILWFPEFFTLILPGWFVNVATIIHSDEALLAVGFIFTIHFFNTHFRPDKFPMDTVVFTGRVPLEEFKHERPKEYEELVRTGQLESRIVEPLPPYVVKAIRIFGATALVLGIGLILLIIWTYLFTYK